jgi:hypothetical protein
VFYRNGENMHNNNKIKAKYFFGLVGIFYDAVSTADAT